MTANFRLVMTKGPEPGQTFTSEKDLIIIGRDPTSDIAVDHPQISRQHAHIKRQGSILVLEDLNSTNGVFVNGVRLVAPHTLDNEDVIGLGDAVAFTFYGQSGLAATVVAPKPTVRTPPPPPPSPPPAQPVYAEPPPAVPYDSEPDAEFYGPPPKKRRTGLWIGCGCGSIIALILLAVIIFFVLDYFRILPPSFYQPLIWLGLDQFFAP